MTKLVLQSVFVLVLSTRTTLMEFMLLNSSKTAVTFSSRIPVAPMLGITPSVRYLLSVSISSESQVAFCSFGVFFTVFLCNVFILQSVLINSAININADDIFMVLNILLMGGYIYSTLIPIYF